MLCLTTSQPQPLQGLEPRPSKHIMTSTPTSTLLNNSIPHPGITLEHALTPSNPLPPQGFYLDLKLFGCRGPALDLSLGGLQTLGVAEVALGEIAGGARGNLMRAQVGLGSWLLFRCWAAACMLGGCAVHAGWCRVASCG